MRQKMVAVGSYLCAIEVNAMEIRFQIRAGMSNSSLRKVKLESLAEVDANAISKKSSEKTT